MKEIMDGIVGSIIEKKSLKEGPFNLQGSVNLEKTTVVSETYIDNG